MTPKRPLLMLMMMPHVTLSESTILAAGMGLLLGLLCNWYSRRLSHIYSTTYLLGAPRSFRAEIVIPLLTAALFVILFHTVPVPFFFPYALFICFLMISVQTDLETMLIPLQATLCALPIPFACAWLGYIPLTLGQSICGAAVGYGILWCINAAFQMYTGYPGLGEGDYDLLCFIGAWLGPLGVLGTLCYGSWVGSILGIGINLFYTHKRIFPFGPFLALGACVFLFFPQIISWLVAQ